MASLRGYFFGSIYVYMERDKNSDTKTPVKQLNNRFGNNWETRNPTAVNELYKVWLMTKYTESNLEGFQCWKSNTK